MINRILNYQLSIFNYRVSGKKIVKHPLFSGSAVMIVGSNLANFFAYIYHLVIGRMLGPAHYGELVAVISVLGLITTSFSFLGLVIVKFVASGDRSESRAFYTWFVKKALAFGFLLSLVFALAIPFLSGFIHVNYSILVLLVPLLLFAVLSFFYRSFLQGLMRFKQMVFAINVDIIGRLLLGVILVHLGLSVFGAVFGILAASLGTLLLLRYFLRDYSIGKKGKKFNLGKKVANYTVPVFFVSLASQSFITTDVILVRHFFDPHSAGIYASLATLGRIIFYGTAPVASVMFPLISKRFSRGEGYKKILIGSFLMTAAIALGVLVVYYFAPELMVTILFGNKFIEAASNLFWIGLFMAIFSLGSLIVNFYLSKEQTKIAYFVIVAALLQVVGIWFFHDSILTVIKVSIISASFLLLGLLVYFGYDNQKEIVVGAYEKRKSSKKK